MGRRRAVVWAAVGLLTALWAAPAVAGQPILERGDRVAITGDSITEQKLYSKYMEAYLLACVPQLELRMMQLGWGGERAPGFQARMENDLIPWKPDVVTTCYGMNDGSYTTYTEAIGDTYDKAMRAIVTRLKEAGATVVVGSPGVVDSDRFRSKVGPVIYNQNLSFLGALSERIAEEEGMPFANVHGAMMQAMERAKALFGGAYHVGGGDGVHPSPNGQLVMAYAFLREMGLDGHIGTITVNWDGEASATDGHKVISTERSSPRAVQVESARYPFCFFGEEKDPGGTLSILPFISFQKELNRFLLKVQGLPSQKAKVRWGNGAKEFSREELSQGVNLAAAFLDNPFREAFQGVLTAVAEKQNYETHMIKGCITQFRNYARDFEPEKLEPVLEKLRGLYFARQAELDAAARAAVQPVRHLVTITPIQ